MTDDIASGYRSTVTRRKFLAGVGAGGALLLLGGCGGSKVVNALSASPSANPTGTLDFTTWASPAEKAAYLALAKRFEAEHSGVTVKVNIVPYAQMAQNIKARLQAGKAPDLFRVTYTDIGQYSANGVLLDISPYFSSSDAAAFIPALWQAIQYQGKPYGIPQQTDTTAILYNEDVFKAAGITSVPTSLASAWSWDEFMAVARKVKAVMPANKYAFSYDWQLTGAYRWLSWLWETGGTLLTPDLKAPAIDSPAGLKAMEFTQNFFTEKLVPPNTNVKGAGWPDVVFPQQTVGMTFSGDFLIPGDIATSAKFKWGATFQPKDTSAATDLGGNAIVAVAPAKNADLAGEFMRFLVAPKNMSSFCAMTNELPTRQDLLQSDIPFAVRPDVMKVFVQQAAAMTPEYVAQVTMPAFSQINATMQTQLDAAFVGGQSASTTVKNLAAGVQTALSQYGS